VEVEGVFHSKAGQIRYFEVGPATICVDISAGKDFASCCGVNLAFSGFWAFFQRAEAPLQRPGLAWIRVARAGVDAPAGAGTSGLSQEKRYCKGPEKARMRTILPSAAQAGLAGGIFGTTEVVPLQNGDRQWRSSKQRPVTKSLRQATSRD